MSTKRLTRLQERRLLDRSQRDTRVRKIRKYRPLCVSLRFIEYARQRGWDNETADAAALVMHKWFMLRRRFDDDGWVPIPFQVFEGMFGTDYVNVRDHLISIGFLEYDEKRKYKKGSHCSRYRICSELRDDKITASYYLTSKELQECYIESQRYWKRISKVKCQELITDGVGQGITPCPQPQTGRASFQASGFPTDSKPFVPNEFSACGNLYIMSVHCQAYSPVRNWQICARV